MNEYVYFIRAENSHVKIGRTVISPEQRLKQLQTGSPQILTLEAVIETPCSISLERELHDKFSDKRVRGEWFELDCEEVSEAVNRYNPKLEDIFKWDRDSYRISSDGCQWELLSSDFDEFAKEHLSKRLKDVSIKVDSTPTTLKKNTGTDHEYSYKNAKITVDNQNGIKFELALTISNLNVSLNVNWLGNKGMMLKATKGGGKE